MEDAQSASWLWSQALEMWLSQERSRQTSIHPLGPYSVKSIGASEAFSLAIGYNPGLVATLTQDTMKLALILLTSEG